MAGKDIEFEVCVDSIASAIIAFEGGASRIELVSALAEGGLTPTVGVLKALKSLPYNKPIYCMLRPRSGNDFLYSELEMTAILSDMDALRENGADGFVFGALTPERTINIENCQRIIANARNIPVTFHRAFDLTSPAYMHDTVATIKELGFSRILSSGFCQNSACGKENLAALIAKHDREIVIMPGSGLTVNNLEDVLRVTNCSEFHASGIIIPVKNYVADTNVKMGKQTYDSYTVADIEVIRKMVSIARSLRFH